MSVTQSGLTLHGPLRYSVRLVVWMVKNGLASYGSTVYAAPPSTAWVGERPRYWRTEARQGLRACEAYLRRPARPT